MFNLKLLKNLTVSEKSVFKIHLLYSMIEGIILGVIALNEFVFIKSLSGNSYSLGILFQFSVIVLLVSVPLNKILSRFYTNPNFIKILALVTRIPLIFLFFFPKDMHSIPKSLKIEYHIIFLGIFAIYYLTKPALLPAINYLLKKNYQEKHFSRLYSYSTSMNKVIMLISTFIYGYLLDKNPNSYQLVFPVIALLGIINMFFFSKLCKTVVNPVKFNEKLTLKFILLQLKDSFHNSVKIIKENKSFRDFEVGFMFYGLAFMIATPITSIFFEEVLDLNYSSVAFYKNSYNIIAILLLPFFGKLLSKIDPRKFAIYTFGSLMLFFFFFAFTQKFPIYVTIGGIKIYLFLIIAYLFHGVFAATMSLLWSIGAVFFCDTSKSGDYQSVHMSLTGFRGVFAPILGIYFYKEFGFFITFMIAVFLLLISVILMQLSNKKCLQHKLNSR